MNLIEITIRLLEKAVQANPDIKSIDVQAYINTAKRMQEEVWAIEEARLNKEIYIKNKGTKA